MRFNLGRIRASLISWPLAPIVSRTIPGLAGWVKTISVQHNFDSLHVWDKPGLSGLFGLSRLFG